MTAVNQMLRPAKRGQDANNWTCLNVTLCLRFLSRWIFNLVVN